MRVMPSYLDPEVLTTCNDCYAFDTGMHKSCSACDSTNVEVINVQEEAQELKVLFSRKKKFKLSDVIKYCALKIRKDDDNI